MFDIGTDIKLPDSLAAAAAQGALDRHLDAALAKRAERLKPAPLLPTPIVAPGAGHLISDDVAGRVAAQWAQTIGATFHHQVLSMSRNRIGGNEVSQKRFVARLKKGLGPAYLCGAYHYGSRAKFHGTFYYVDAVASAGIRYGLRDAADDWIGICGGMLDRPGVNREGFTHTGIMCAFSRHAIARMVQRAALQSADAIPTALRACVPALMLSVLMSDATVPKGTMASWLVPVRVPNLPDPIVLVFAKAEPGSKVDCAVIRTVLNFQMLRADQQEACGRLLAAMPEKAPSLKEHGCWRPLKEMFDAVRQE